MLPPLVLVALFVGFWYFVSRVWMSERRRFLVPPPDEVVREGFLEWDNLHELLDALWSSVRVAGIGLAISVVLGVALATLMSQSKLIERATFPLMVALQAMPILTLVPMIAIIFGSNQTSRVIVCVLITIFPIVLNTLFGLVSGDPGLHDLITLHHGGRDPSAQGDVPVGPAGDVRRAAHLGRAVRHRRDRRRLLLRQGREGPRSADPAVRQQLQRRQLYATTIVAATLGIVVFLSFGVLQHAVIGAWYDSKSGGGR